MTTGTVADDLRALLGPDRVLTSPEFLRLNASDRKTTGDLPDVVVRARSTEDVATVLRFANEQGVPVFPRGAASNSTGACVPLGGGIVLDVTGMTDLRIDTANLQAEAGPGVITAHLAREAEARGLFYGPDPAGWEESTIGGNVATCAGGPSTIKYGVTRDWLLGLEVVLPTGEMITTGARTAKSVAGFDLTRLMCGSAGLLGVVTKVRLRLIPKPPERQSMLVEFASLDRCMVAVQGIFASGVLPCALEFLDRASIRLLREAGGFAFRDDTAALLILSVDGEAAGVAAQMATLAKVMEDHASAVQEATSPEEEQGIWSARSRLSPLLKTIAPGKVNEDICVPRSTLPALLDFTTALEAEFAIPIATFGHLGDGNLHVNLMYDPGNDVQSAAVTTMRDRLMDRVLDLGGTITGEHGVGIVKKDWLARELGPVSLELQRRIKAAFDPHGILNPGKVL